MSEKKANSRKGGEKPKKRITWRQVCQSFSHRYGTIIWERANNTQSVKIYNLHKRGDKWFIVKVTYYLNGIEQRILNFQNRTALYDPIQRN